MESFIRYCLITACLSAVILTLHIDDGLCEKAESQVPIAENNKETAIIHGRVSHMGRKGFSMEGWRKEKVPRTKIFVYTYRDDGVLELLRTIESDEEGNYKIAVEPGYYFVSINKVDIGPEELESLIWKREIDIFSVGRNEYIKKDLYTGFAL